MNISEINSASVHEEEEGNPHYIPGSGGQEQDTTYRSNSSTLNNELGEAEVSKKESPVMDSSSETLSKSPSAPDGTGAGDREDTEAVEAEEGTNSKDIPDTPTADQDVGDTDHNMDIQEHDDIQTKTALEQLDMNRMFKVNSNKLLLKHSPLKVDSDPPSKLSEQNSDPEDDDHNQPRKRLKLGPVPNLDDNGNSKERPPTATNELSTTPMAIDIVSFSNTHTSPNSREYITSTSTENSHTRNGSENLSDSFSSSHRLSPVRVIHPDNGDTNKLNIDRGHVNGEILMVATRNNELIDEIHRTHKQINTLVKGYDQLNAKYSEQVSGIKVLTRENEDLAKRLEDSERKNELNVENNQKLVAELAKIKDEMNMANSNQNLLQNKFDSVCKEADRWKEENEVLLKSKTELERQFSIVNEKLAKLSEERLHIESKVNDLGNEKGLLQNALDGTTEQLENARKEVIARDQQIVELNTKLDEYLNSEKGTSEDTAQLINDLTDEKNRLERELQDVVLSKDNELKTLNNDLSELKSSLTTLHSNLDNLSVERDTLKTELGKRDNELSILNRLFDEANDESKVRYAEVRELKEKLETLKEERESVDALNEKLQSELNENKKQLEEQKRNLQRASLELDGVQDRSSTTDEEHKKELEKLRDVISSLESTLEAAQESTERLREENKSLQQQLEENENEKGSDQSAGVTSAEEQQADNEELQRLRENFDAQAREQGEEIKSLQNQLLVLREKLEQKDKDANKRLKLLAEDLYHQYSSKHEQKVRTLKKSYEKRYKLEIDKLTVERDGFREEIERLKKLLLSEREEKKELLRSMEAIE